MSPFIMSFVDTMLGQLLLCCLRRNFRPSCFFFISINVWIRIRIIISVRSRHKTRYVFPFIVALIIIADHSRWRLGILSNIVDALCFLNILRFCVVEVLLLLHEFNLVIILDERETAWTCIEKLPTFVLELVNAQDIAIHCGCIVKTIQLQLHSLSSLDNRISRFHHFLLVPKAPL